MERQHSVPGTIVPYRTVPPLSTTMYHNTNVYITADETYRIPRRATGGGGGGCPEGGSRSGRLRVFWPAFFFFWGGGGGKGRGRIRKEGAPVFAQNVMGMRVNVSATWIAGGGGILQSDQGGLE